MMEHSAMQRIKRVVVARRLSGNPTGWLNCKAEGE